MTSSNNNRFYVYVHRRKTDNSIFYVGKGTGYRYKRTNRNIYWQNIVAKNGYYSEFVIKNLTESQAISLEVNLIKFYGRENLCNMTDGGEGMSGHVKSQSAKDAVGNAHRGVKRHKSVGEKISKSLVGRKLNAETKRKISEKLKGVKLSEETIRKMAESRTGKKHKDAWNANIAKAWKTDSERYKRRCLNMSLAAKRTKVKCITHNTEFDSVNDAVAWLKVTFNKIKANHSSICRSCKSKEYSYYGMKWEYV